MGNKLEGKKKEFKFKFSTLATRKCTLANMIDPPNLDSQLAASPT